MKELVGQVNKLVMEEKTRAMIEHPLFFSRHQGYAILKEEIEETGDELEDVNAYLNNMWRNIKSDNVGATIDYAKNIKRCAINLSAEAIQVAAVAQKFIDSFKVENE